MRTEKIEYVDPEVLMRDPNQPRQIWNKEVLEEIKSLAETYEKHGVIEPLEVDEDNVIVLGERRWRASLFLKKKGVDIKVPIRRKVGLSADVRFLRQLTDDAQRKDLSALERGWAYATAIITINTGSYHSIHEVKNMKKSYLSDLTDKSKSPGQAQKCGQSELSRQIRVPRITILYYLSLLKAEPETQKALEEGKVLPSYVVEAVKAPPELKSFVEKEVVEGKFETGKKVREAVKVVSESVEKSQQVLKGEKEVSSFVKEKYYLGLITEEQAEELKVKFENLEKQIASIKGSKKAKYRAKLFKNWIAHGHIVSVGDSLFCPICGKPADKNLLWKCHNLTIIEADEKLHKKLESD